MNVALNGTTVFTGLDVWTSAGGKNRAYDLIFSVSVTNGQVTIALTCTSSNHSAEVNAIQIVAAGSTPQQYYLTTAVSPSGGGTISPACAGGCLYSSGSPATITATPAPGYQFSGFTGSIGTAANPLTITMNSAMTETANFTAASGTSSEPSANPPLTAAGTPGSLPAFPFLNAPVVGSPAFAPSQDIVIDSTTVGSIAG